MLTIFKMFFALFVLTTMCSFLLQVQSNLTYEVYVYYLAQGEQSENEFINSMKKMIHPANIIKYGSKVCTNINLNTNIIHLSISNTYQQFQKYPLSILKIKKTPTHGLLCITHHLK